MKLGIGIDTGGTYTDAVLYNFEDKAILGTSKSLTTKDNLSIGILGAIDGLPVGLVQKAEFISLSTTLATNACVENKGGQAKLIFFGADKNAVDTYGRKYGLPPSKDIYIQESFSRFTGEFDREMDWVLFEKQIENGFEHLDGVGIIEVNAVRNGAVLEKKAKGIFQKKYDIPVVCAYELFAELGCLRRASSTLLNASLFPVINEFLAAVKKALTVRGIKATIVIVRSDGSLMSEKFAAVRPVETLLCGPAASAISGTQLTDNPNSIIVDMGGTTTDIALVKNGVPVKANNGVSIGKWKTFVDGIYIKTFGLGGDSAVHYCDNNIFLEDYRVIPLCIAAKKYPVIAENMKWLKIRKHTHFLYEHYILVKDISENARYTDEEKAFCNALKKGPLILTEAAGAAGKDVYAFNVKRLIKDSVVQVCGLTPTDIMHIKGDFNQYNSEVSLLGAEFAAFNLDMPIQGFCDIVYEKVKQKLYLNIVTVLLEHRYPDYMKNGINTDVERFINDNYEEVKRGSKDNMLSTMFSTGYKLVGIGAPIRIFLTDVAKMLGTNAVIPEHYEVANALGAIIGSISAYHSVEVRADNDADGTPCYIVYGGNENKVFQRIGDALDYAASEAKERAEIEAVKRGAKGKITVTSDVHNQEAEARDCIVYFGATVTARAVGSVGL